MQRYNNISRKVSLYLKCLLRLTWGREHQTHKNDCVCHIWLRQTWQGGRPHTLAQPQYSGNILDAETKAYCLCRDSWKKGWGSKDSEKRTDSEEKDVDKFGSFRKNDYLSTRWWAIKRLVAQRRVFFDAVYSRMWNLVRLPNRNPIFLQFPKLPLYKEKLRNLPKLRKKLVIRKQFWKFFASRSNFVHFARKESVSKPFHDREPFHLL